VYCSRPCWQGLIQTVTPRAYACQPPLSSVYRAPYTINLLPLKPSICSDMSDIHLTYRET
jgi:hypothetical protein